MAELQEAKTLEYSEDYRKNIEERNISNFIECKTADFKQWKELMPEYGRGVKKVEVEANIKKNETTIGLLKKLKENFGEKLPNAIFINKDISEKDIPDSIGYDDDSNEDKENKKNTFSRIKKNGGYRFVSREFRPEEKSKLLLNIATHRNKEGSYKEESYKYGGFTFTYQRSRKTGTQYLKKVVDSKDILIFDTKSLKKEYCAIKEKADNNIELNDSEMVLFHGVELGSNSEEEKELSYAIKMDPNQHTSINNFLLLDKKMGLNAIKNYMHPITLDQAKAGIRKHFIYDRKTVPFPFILHTGGHFIPAAAHIDKNKKEIDFFQEDCLSMVDFGANNLVGISGPIVGELLKDKKFGGYNVVITGIGKEGGRRQQVSNASCLPNAIAEMVSIERNLVPALTDEKKFKNFFGKNVYEYEINQDEFRLDRSKEELEKYEKKNENEEEYDDDDKQKENDKIEENNNDKQENIAGDEEHENNDYFVNKEVVLNLSKEFLENKESVKEEELKCEFSLLTEQTKSKLGIKNKELEEYSEYLSYKYKNNNENNAEDKYKETREEVLAKYNEELEKEENITNIIKFAEKFSLVERKIQLENLQKEFAEIEEKIKSKEGDSAELIEKMMKLQSIIYIFDTGYVLEEDNEIIGR